MKTLKATLALAPLSIALVSSTADGQGIYWQDNFDSFGSPSTITAAGTANGYDILFNASAGPSDFGAVFGYDYSAAGIPSAPNSGGSTRGLQLYVNKDATVANTAVNLYPTGLSVSGDFKLRFDLWMNYPSSGNTTEHALFGINHSGTFANRAANAAGSDGLFFAMSGEGGSSGTSTTARDYSVFRGQGAGLAPLLLRTNNFTFGPDSGIGNSFDNADPLAGSTFPSGSHPYGFSGVPGMRWVQGEVRQETVDGSPLVTWMLNGVIFAQYTNSTAYTAGDIMIGYNDIFTSVSPADTYVVFDNIVVSTIPEPTTAVLAGMGAVAMIGYIRRRRN